jgi:signal recognition particle subunit SRP54
MASRILDLGDMLTLIEHAEKAFEADQAAEMARKLAKGNEFTLNDFLDQMQAIKKMGSFKSIINMLPGAGQMREALEEFDDRQLDRIQAIIRSMTPAERENPKIINGSRRLRIARGSGVQVSEVNQLVERFFAARDMMSQAARGKLGGLGGMPGIPGMAGGIPGLGGGKKSKGKQPKKQKRRGARSGNPAKRAAQLAEAEQRRNAEPEPGQLPGAFGGDATNGDAGDFELPDDVADFFKNR